MGAQQQALLMAAGTPAAAYLDQLATTPTYAWGIKKLISTATVAIRVQRSSDSTEQDIGFTGNTLDTTALLAFVGGGNGVVVTVYNQTGIGGSGANLSTGATRYPRIVNGGVYDDQLVFDGSNDALFTSSSVTMGTAYAHLFAQWEQTTDASVRVLAELGTNYSSNDNRFVIYTYSVQGAMIMGMGTGGSKLTSFPNASGMGVWSYLFDKSQTGITETQAWRAGSSLTPTAVAAGNVTGTFETTGLYVGARGGASLYTAMKFRVLAVYNADVSALRTSIEAIVGA